MPNNQEIKGNTLKIYLYLLKNGSSELRNIQRSLNLSSASLASYHLGKLIELGYVQQDEHGKYAVQKDSSDKVLEGYSKVGSAVVPQLFFFSLLFTIIAAFFSYSALFLVGYVPYLVGICAGMVAVFWFETIRLWRKLAA
jgi:hypothetical protein